MPIWSRIWHELRSNPIGSLIYAIIGGLAGSVILLGILTVIILLMEGAR